MAELNYDDLAQKYFSGQLNDPSQSQELKRAILQGEYAAPKQYRSAFNKKSQGEYEQLEDEYNNNQLSPVQRDIYETHVLNGWYKPKLQSVSGKDPNKSASENVIPSYRNPLVAPQLQPTQDRVEVTSELADETNPIEAGFAALGGVLTQPGRTISRYIGSEEERKKAEEEDAVANRVRGYLRNNNPVASLVGETAPYLVPTAGAATGLGRIAANTALGGAVGGLEYAKDTKDRLINTAVGTMMGLGGGLATEAVSKLAKPLTANKKIVGEQGSPQSVSTALEFQDKNPNLTPLGLAEVASTGTAQAKAANLQRDSSAYLKQLKDRSESVSDYLNNDLIPAIKTRINNGKFIGADVVDEAALQGDAKAVGLLAQRKQLKDLIANNADNNTIAKTAANVDFNHGVYVTKKINNELFTLARNLIPEEASTIPEKLLSKLKEIDVESLPGDVKRYITTLQSLPKNSRIKYDGLDDLKKRINSGIDQAVIQSNIDQSQLRLLSGAVEDDINNLIGGLKNAGEVKKARTAANNFYKENVSMLKQARFKAAADTQDYRTAFDMFVKSDNPELQKQMMKYVGDQAKDSFLLNILENGISSSKSNAPGATAGILNLSSLNKKLSKYENYFANGISDDMKNTVNGLRSFINFAQRNENKLLNPQAPNSLYDRIRNSSAAQVGGAAGAGLGMMLGGGAGATIGGALGATLAIAGEKSLAKLARSKAGTKMLLKLTDPNVQLSDKQKMFNTIIERLLLSTTPSGE